MMKGFVKRPQEKRRIIHRILIAAALLVFTFITLVAVGLMLHARVEFLRERREMTAAETIAALPADDCPIFFV